MAYTDYLTLKPLAFGVVDRLTGLQDGAVMVVPRASSLDAGTLSLLAEAAERPEFSRVDVAVRSPQTFEAARVPLEDGLESLDIDIRVVEVDTGRFVSALARSEVLFLMNQYSVPNYRLFSSHRKRDVVRVHHGILTKAYGNFAAANLERQARRRHKKLGYPSRQKYVTNLNIDVQSVESDVEAFYRAAAEGRCPDVFKRYGYPRFDRLERLLRGDATPILPIQTAERLHESDRFKVLYAPTHKDREFETTLFPFPGFDAARLHAFLRDRGIELYVRMHVNEDRAEFYREVVDGETVVNAGQSFSPSPTEILPSFDALVTDYSSIYLDYLPVDNPVVFVKDGHEAFLERRGIAFDYEEYFPGRKVGGFGGFLESLDRCAAEGDDGHGDDRAFVRRVLLPGRERTFMEHVVENHLG